MTVIAHGAGDLTALGIPISVVLLVAASTVPALAGLLSTRAARSHGPAPAASVKPLPRFARTVLDAPSTRAVARYLVLAAFVGLLAVAAFGTERVTGNPAPRLALIVVWGLVALGSVLLGPVWGVVSPFRTLTGWLTRLTDPRESAVTPLPDRLGVWPGVAALGIWAVAAEVLVSPRPTLVLLLAYSTVQILAGLSYGRGWFARGEALEVYSTWLGRMAPLTRDEDGHLSLRNPLSALARVTPVPGIRALLAVILGWELLHAATETERWLVSLAALGLPRSPWVTILALAVAIALASMVVRAATPKDFLVPALIPLVAGWALAHHVGPLLVDTRAVLADLADPFARGWALFDLSGPPIEPTAPGAVALAQLLVLLTGVLLTVAAAHRMSVSRYDLRAARAVQFPLRAMSVLVILAGIALQAGAI